MQLSRKSQTALSALIGALVFAGIEGGRLAYRFSQPFHPEYEEVLRRILIFDIILNTALATLLGGLAGLMIARFRIRLIFAILIGFLLGALLPLLVVGFRMAVSDRISFNYLFEGYGGLVPFLQVYLTKGIVTGMFGAIAGFASQIFVSRMGERSCNETGKLSPPPPPEFSE